MFYPPDRIDPEAERLDHVHPAMVAWRTHVEAGRIGSRLPADPAIAANRERTEALLLPKRGTVR